MANRRLRTHYELLREDAVRGLREAISRVKCTPEAKEEAFNDAVGIYDPATAIFLADVLAHCPAIPFHMRKSSAILCVVGF